MNATDPGGARAAVFAVTLALWIPAPAVFAATPGGAYDLWVVDAVPSTPAQNARSRATAGTAMPPTTASEPARQMFGDGMAAPVISLDAISRSGAGPSTLRVLSIGADGTVMVSSGGGFPRRFDTLLPPGELVALQRFILEQQRFAEIDGPALAQQVGSVADDAAIVVIRVNTDEGPHQVALEALPDAAVLRPGIEPLQRLHAIYQALMRLVHVTIIGGEAALAAAVAEVNAVLAREHPQAQPLGVDHLLEAHAVADGGVRLSLLRVDPPADGQPGLRWYAEMHRPAIGQAQVRIWRRPG